MKVKIFNRVIVPPLCYLIGGLSLKNSKSHIRIPKERFHEKKHVIFFTSTTLGETVFFVAELCIKPLFLRLFRDIRLLFPVNIHVWLVYDPVFPYLCTTLVLKYCTTWNCEQHYLIGRLSVLVLPNRTFLLRNIT